MNRTIDNAPDSRSAAVEHVVSVVLLWGGILSIVVVVAGMALHLRSPTFARDAATLAEIRSARETGLAEGTFISVRDVSRGLAERPIDPLAVVSVGLGLLLLTPVAGVAFAALAFMSIRDYRYVLIASLVLAILITSFFVTSGGGQPRAKSAAQNLREGG